MKDIETTVTINAPVQKVWEVFKNPEMTKKIGGEYITSWKEGSFFGFKKLDGTMATQGILLAVEPHKLLSHTLFEEDEKTVMATLTYTFKEEDGKTVLSGREEFRNALSVAEYKDAKEGWQLALSAVKGVAEG
jgi:uncharacterized protein YndB with AHSA1/START domain